MDAFQPIEYYDEEDIMKKSSLFLFLALSLLPKERPLAKVKASELRGMEGIQVNRENACAWEKSRLSYYCWGRSDGGLHGTNNYTETGFIPYARRNILNDLQGINNHFISLSIGSNGACGVRIDGQALCWGSSYYRLGSKPRTFYRGSAKGHYPLPVYHPGENLDDLSDDYPLNDFISIELGRARELTCGIREIEGVSSAWCWGLNFYGVLGNGDNTSFAFYPTQVLKKKNSPLTDVASIHVEAHHVCAVTRKKGYVYCWGRNNLGTVGGGILNNKTYTYAGRVQISRDEKTNKITYLSGVRDMDVGYRHNCAIKDKNGELWCWGSGYGGVLGNGNPFSRSAFAIQAQESHGTALTEVEDVALSQDVTCIIKHGRPMCFGQSSHGHLGNGKIGKFNALYPKPVIKTSIDGLTSHLSNATSISANNFTICAVASSEGQVYCWGQNRYFLLGNTNTDNKISSGFAQKVLRVDQ